MHVKTGIAASRSRCRSFFKTITIAVSAIISHGAIAGQGIEPLDPSEVARAESIVMAAIDRRQMIASGARTELLRTEVFDPGKASRSTGRLARVFVYDYSANQLIVGRIDLVTGEVRRLKSMTRKQPPLSTGEIDRARSITLSDPETVARVAAEYTRITGEAFDPGDLTVHVRGFNPELARNRTNRRSANCLSRRCARITLVTDGSTLFQFVPIVDLSSGEVIQNIPFGPGNDHARQTRQRARENRNRMRRAGNNHGNHAH